MEEGTQAEAYDIDGQPLFDVPLATGITFYLMPKRTRKASTRRILRLTQKLMFRTWRWTAWPPQPRRIRYQRGPLATHPRRTCVFAGLSLQLAKTPFLVPRKGKGLLEEG
jgi:hypothetical protein